MIKSITVDYYEREVELTVSISFYQTLKELIKERHDHLQSEIEKLELEKKDIERSLDVLNQGTIRETW